MAKILIVGANGQIGSELVGALAAKHGAQNVIATDISPNNLYAAPRYQVLDILDKAALAKLVEEEEIDQVYQLAALLSATGEAAPLKAWTLNMDGLLNILEVARVRLEAGKPMQVFWPSSIAAFGPNTPPVNTPQMTVMDPSTIYGISKLAGERLCEYYFAKYGVDVRSIRYPGIISYKSPPGGGTTDYAIAIFHAALKNETYSCFLEADTTLPMIYMPDAIRATIELMEAPSANIAIRSAYNIDGLSFNPQELFEAIRAKRPEFQIEYKPDARQQIAKTWPQSLDDSKAQQDWGWEAHISLPQLVDDMLANITV
ncbi:MAG: NAD-dependent epimerase/dehydratase family protein [Burkholderiales bacterium]|nr:NAD-dependent epimerase/dehydratase family protein [Burkholderiales bacterium]